MSRKSFLIGFSILALAIMSNCEIFIEYAQNGESKILFDYLSSTPSGFYVDIGAYDPTLQSKTLNLYANGWGGVNIDANPKSINRFNTQRPDQTNLNYAIGEKDVFATFYEMDDDSTSIVSSSPSNSKQLIKQIKIPSLGFNQICERYFYRRPIFMNIGTKADQILESNNWSNQQCVPDIIMVQTSNNVAGSHEKILQKKGYKKVTSTTAGPSSIFILEKMYETYEAKAKIARLHSANFQTVKFTDLAPQIARILNITTKEQKHYEASTNQIYYQFAKPNSFIGLQKMNIESNLLGSKQNRPIVLYNFNPAVSTLLIESGDFERKKIKVDRYRFVEIKVTKKDGSSFYVYVFDHQYENAKGIEIYSKIYKVDEELYEIGERYNEEVTEDTIHDTSETEDQNVQNFEDTTLQKVQVELEKINTFQMLTMTTASAMTCILCAVVYSSWKRKKAGLSDRTTNLQ